MASLDPPPVTPSKVTLTNWVRLNNSPLLLPRASAIQWNDYIFVLARDGTALLYHAKLKLWSMLPKCPYSMNDNIPLVNYRGEIRGVIKPSEVRGEKKPSQICAFDVARSSWKEVSGPSTAQEIIHMAVNHDTLRVYAKKQYRDFFISTLTTEGWKENYIGVNQTASKLLLTSDYIFLEVTETGYHHGKHTCEGIYRQKIKKTSESKTESDDTPIKAPKKIALPPYKAFTLHVLKDTLLSFGGRDEDNQPTSDVLRYNSDTDTWESAGYMRSARYNVAVATVQQDTTTEVYVLGGEFGSTKLKMKPKLHTSTESTSTDQTANWDCSTSIVEKCTLSD